MSSLSRLPFPLPDGFVEITPDDVPFTLSNRLTKLDREEVIRAMATYLTVYEQKVAQNPVPADFLPNYELESITDAFHAAEILTCKQFKIRMLEQLEQILGIRYVLPKTASLPVRPHNLNDGVGPYRSRSAPGTRRKKVLLPPASSNDAPNVADQIQNGKGSEESVTPPSNEMTSDSDIPNTKLPPLNVSPAEAVEAYVSFLKTCPNAMEAKFQTCKLLGIPTYEQFNELMSAYGQPPSAIGPNSSGPAPGG